MTYFLQGLYFTDTWPVVLLPTTILQLYRNQSHTGDLKEIKIFWFKAIIVQRIFFVQEKCNFSPPPQEKGTYLEHAKYYVIHQSSASSKQAVANEHIVLFTT